jgi:hypothetical protein
MNSSYRVLKLQSGEEIIAKIKGRDRGRIILDNPMVFETSTRNDAFGNAKEITFLKDWLINAVENTIRIPENFIISWLKPSPGVTRLYDLERNIKQDDTGHDQFPSVAGPGRKPKPQSGRPPFDMDSLLDAINSLGNNVDIDSDDPKINKPKDNSFFMHMMIPPEMVRELFEQGMLDMDDIFDDDDDDDDDPAAHKEINEHKYTGDQNKEDPNYGNRWTDWNPNPNDDEYL